MQNITELNYADNVPSACTITVDKAVEDKIGRSHIIFESRSMGLILRYVLEREYDIEVDFCDTVLIRERAIERTFSFSELEIVRNKKFDEKNNGTVRATINGELHCLEDGGVFSADTWKPVNGIMTNFGMFKYDRIRPLELLPKIMRLHGLSVSKVKGS